MVINRGDMKRKRKDDCSSTLLDDSPKRTKVHAQRKFAQGSNVNSPAITPVKEIERQDVDVLPEPVELLPIKRPNTEDFLTFLCFRGTPILPPSLNFFNTASIVDTNGQVHEVKSESPKNGPIDTSAITKTGSGSSERPFVAFGVRKRADPIVISRQMDKKRRHALTIQALRRKYQEQRMAKIRAVTISKLSEKVTNKTMVRTNSVSKTETVTKNKSTIQKTKVKVVATKVTTHTVKTALRPKIKPKMCLRSFRGRFVQKELQFRNVKKKLLPDKKVVQKAIEVEENDSEFSTEYSSDDDEPLLKPVKVPEVPKVAKKSAPGPKKPAEMNFRVTRSSKFLSNKIVSRRQQIKQRLILSTPNTIVKPRTLRSQTIQKSLLSKKAKNLLETKDKVARLKSQKVVKKVIKESDSVLKKTVKSVETSKNDTNKKEMSKMKETITKKDTVKTKVTDNNTKKETSKTLEITKKETNKSESFKKEIQKKEIQKKDGSKSVVMLKKISNKTTENVEKRDEQLKENKNEAGNLFEKTTKKNEDKVVKKESTVKKNEEVTVKREAAVKQNEESIVKKEPSLKKNEESVVNKKEAAVKKNDPVVAKNEEIVLKKEASTKKNEFAVKKIEETIITRKDAPAVKKNEECATKKEAAVVNKKESNQSIDHTVTKKEVTIRKTPLVESSSKKAALSSVLNKKEDSKAKQMDSSKELPEMKTSQRPTRKTKEAAAIYMEILSHKLVHEDKIDDDDNVSIDSFPELPNVKRTEQRENELKAKAKCTKVSADVAEVECKKLLMKQKEDELDLKKMVEGRKKESVALKKQRDTTVQSCCSAKILVESKEKDDATVSKENIDGFKENAELNAKTKSKNIIQIIDSDDDILVDRAEISKIIFGIDLATNKKDDGRVNIKPTTITTKELTKPPEIKSGLSLKEKLKEIDTKVQVILDKDKAESSKSKKELLKKCEVKKDQAQRKRKSQSDKNDESDRSNDSISLKIRKSEGANIANSKTRKNNATNNETTRRQTRNTKIESDIDDDSDESFFVDIKISRKKPLTRSNNVMGKSLKNTVDDNDDYVGVRGEKTGGRATSQRLYIEFSSTESDILTASDVNENANVLLNVTKNKRFTKTKNQKVEENFSDSDEEPLSKLTLKTGKTIQKESNELNHIAVKKQQQQQKLNEDKDDKKSSSVLAVTVDETVMKEKICELGRKNDESIVDNNLLIQPKQKRECAKRPQNYLPMFSSSDEEDKCFHGFAIKNEKITTTMIKPPNKIAENCIVQHVPPSSDLLYKDIGRRFGKGKVNMSNEQIEKWLKDSALAGSSIKKENDEMLKFGEKIPTETFLTTTTNSSIDTQKLKTSLLLSNVIPTTIPAIITGDDKIIELDSEKSTISPESKSTIATVTNTNCKLILPAKPVVIDRKLIFRKEKISRVPNKNAFSANNESSVYAFGEETDVIMKTPFRRVTRRPSSTATSKSEDESSKYEESFKSGHFRKPTSVRQDLTKFIRDVDDSNISTPAQSNDISSNIESSHTETEDTSHFFYTPLYPCKSSIPKSDSTASSSMIPPACVGAVPKAKSSLLYDNKNLSSSRQNSRSFDRFSETSEEFKYKIPSSPSASSSSSAKLSKKQNAKSKLRSNDVCSEKLTDFPLHNAGTPAQMVEAPTFYPSDKEFQDPIEYLEKIRLRAEQFGICRIVPPATFKPECKVTDDMRFTAYNQYVHKLLHRWGPNFKELMAIKKYLSTQNINLSHPPWIGGMEVDLPRLYQTVQSLGGLKEVIEKKKWPKVSDAMKIPKFAQDRVTKLDDIYCKYLLPYDTLSLDEREKLFDEVETEWAKRESKTFLKVQQNIEDNNSNDAESESYDEAEECIVKGRNIALNAFYRIARNTMSMWFKSTEPLAEEVEQEFWKHVTLRQNHICVHSGSIDSGNWGYGFAVSKNSPFARHAWNLKVLTNNSGSVLRSLGPIMGVTVPTLHVGMVFSSCCWYRDPHTLPWIEYLHTGGNKIWYGIPNSTSGLFQMALKNLVPNYCRNKTLWLPSDTAMVPPNLLVENGVSLSRLVQEPGQFVVVFPKVFTSSLSTGYVVSESVYFAPPRWLDTAKEVFDDLRSSCESSMFSLDRLLLSIVADARSNIDVLKQIIPAVHELCDKEMKGRCEIKLLGVVDLEKLPLPDAPNARKRKKMQKDDGDYECKICRMNLFVSMIIESQDDAIYCLEHAIEEIKSKLIQSKNCKFMYTYDDDELKGMVDRIHSIIEYKIQKKIPNKYAGMPTLLTK